jgi:aryl-alcohol dehydrogenase-like predicted oxidoreductase
MRYATLGPGGPRVSQIAVGSWELTSAWGSDVGGAALALRRAAELGVTAFDTARAYGFGVAEIGLSEAIGDLLRSNRGNFVVSTKGGIELRGDIRYRNSRPEALENDLKASLQALRLDYVDIFFIHWPDPLVPADEVAGGLRSLVAAGLTRWVGVSNFDVAQMGNLGGGGTIDVAQIPYSLFRREAEDDLIPYCLAEGIALTGFSPLAQGLLTGVFQPDRPPAGDWRATESEFQGERFAVRMRAVELLRQQASARSCTLPQLALAWVLANPAGVIPILGAQAPSDVEDSLAAVDVELSAEEARLLSGLVASVTRDVWQPSTRTPRYRDDD